MVGSYQQLPDKHGKHVWVALEPSAAGVHNIADLPTCTGMSLCVSIDHVQQCSALNMATCYKGVAADARQTCCEAYGSQHSPPPRLM